MEGGQCKGCLVPAGGFWEPEKPGRTPGKAPWSYYSMNDRRPFFMAGLWSNTPDPATGEIIDSYTVIITDANAAMRVHDRMPVILGTDAARRWSEPGPLPADILVPYPADEITTWRVGDAANDSRNEPHRGWRNRSRRPVDVPVRPPPRTLVPFPQYHILSGPYPFPVEGRACNE